MKKRITKKASQVQRTTFDMYQHTQGVLYDAKRGYKAWKGHLLSSLGSDKVLVGSETKVEKVRVHRRGCWTSGCTYERVKVTG